MESTALEEKINKIRLRNEEIKRRHEEVEADKKNAAKLDALVEPLPVDDWPERKEPPEFSVPLSKHTNKPKHTIRKHGDQGSQYYSSGDGKKAHNFADGQGPPPDPKYNFLADSEREEYGEQISKDTEKNRGRNKPPRGGFRRRGSGRDWHTKEQWGQHANPGDMTASEYEAWRAERNRIDEARISRQRTAEGNWRREWDNDKVHLADDVTKRDNRVTLGDIATRHEHSDNEKHYRSPRTTPRNTYHSNARESHHVTAVPETNKNHGTVNDPEKRVVIATDKSIKVMVNHGNTSPKSSVMSVKVSSPNIAGTGRVGPRQRPRMMYSSQQSEVEAPNQDGTSVARQKSVEEKTKGRQFDQAHKTTVPKSPHAQRRRDGDVKSGYPPRRDTDKAEGTGKPIKKDSQKSPYPQRRGNASNNYPPKSPRNNRRSIDAAKQKHNSENSNASSSRDTPKGGDIVANSQDPTKKNNDKKIDNDLPKEPIVDKSTSSTVEPIVESTNNASDSDKIEKSLIEEATANSVIDTVEKTTENAESTKKESSDESFGEASGSQEVKGNSTNNIDIESANSQAINCSANSGMTSNDSGYIELPSDNSIHDVSENDTVETSGIGDTSSESLNFSGQIAEEHPTVENLEVEPKVSNEQRMDAPKPSSSNSEKTLEPIDDNPEVEPKATKESSSSHLEKESEPVIDNPEVILKITDENIMETTKQVSSIIENTSDEVTKISEVESKVSDGQTMEDTIIDTSNSASVELKLQADDAVTSDIVPERIDKNLQNSANENLNVGVDRVESVHEESNSIQGESDLSKEAANSDSALSEPHVEKAEKSSNIPDEIDNNRHDAINDNAITGSPQLEKQKDDITAEVSLKTVESTEGTTSTSKDEMKNSNDIVQDTILVAETTSSPADEKD